MISTIDQISLTYILGGESLVKAGVYSTAKVTVKNYKGQYGSWKQLSPKHFKCSTGEELIIDESSRTLSSPEYSQAVQHTTLTPAFTEQCLSRPVKPKGRNINWWLRSAEGQLFQSWKKLTEEQRIEARLKIYCEDLGGELLSWNI